VPQPSISDAAIRNVLQELLRIDPVRSNPQRSWPIEANVESLHRATGLARGTVHNALKRLEPVLSSRRHRQDTALGRRGGKPTILYQLARDAAEALVLDFDHDRVTAWKADAFGDLRPMGMRRVEVDNDPETAIALGADLLRGRSIRSWENLVGIGLSLPAPVDPQTQRTLGGVLKRWEATNTDALLREHLRHELAGLPLKIIADNDANLAALAEYRYRDTRTPHDQTLSNLFLVKTVPGHIGIGGGAVINGQQLQGRGFAMEFGHLSIDSPKPDEARDVECPHCKRTNCLQARISTDALIGGDHPPPWDSVVRRTRENVRSILGARENATKADETSEVAQLDARLRALSATDLYVRAIVTAGREMGRALAKVVTLLDPDVIALEGALAQAWLATGAASIHAAIGDPVRDTLLECAPLARARPAELSLALAQANCAHGAAAAVLDTHLPDFILTRLKAAELPDAALNQPHDQ
jgi:predicted NBD/HSP70 family sugar kinase